MALLAVSLFAVAVIYFSIHYPRFRRGVYIAAGIALGLVAVAGIYIWQEEERVSAERERSKSLVKVSDIEVSNATLSLGVFGRLRATIANNSRHTLTDIILNVQVFECPQVIGDSKKPKCRTVGEALASEYFLTIPPGQSRAIDPSVNFENLPELKEGDWNWSFSVTEIRATDK